MSHEMPEVLPIFPLTGVVLLPGGRLPLHVFEPRYCNMVDDALGGDGIIGMVQPRVADLDDNRGEGVDADAPEVYSVGCAGKIEHHEVLPEERHLVLLQGLRRFRIASELDLHRGYRRMQVSYEEFSGDAIEGEIDVAPEELLSALRRFGESHRMKIELDQLGDVSGLALLNSVAMAMPFAPEEKQALLEARDLEARQAMLLTLLDMGLDFDRDELPAPN